jgi:NAD-dependent DNA ligase
MTTKTKIEELAVLLNKIYKQYHRLELGCIFQHYHDSVYTQYECAKETYQELVWMHDNDVLDQQHLDDQINDFLYTLNYVTIIADLSKQLNNLPDPVYC